MHRILKTFKLNIFKWETSHKIQLCSFSLKLGSSGWLACPFWVEQDASAAREASDWLALVWNTLGSTVMSSSRRFWGSVCAWCPAMCSRVPMSLGLRSGAAAQQVKHPVHVLLASSFPEVEAMRKTIVPTPRRLPVLGGAAAHSY